MYYLFSYYYRRIGKISSVYVFFFFFASPVYLIQFHCSFIAFNTIKSYFSPSPSVCVSKLIYIPLQDKNLLLPLDTLTDSINQIILVNQINLTVLCEVHLLYALKNVSTIEMKKKKGETSLLKQLQISTKTSREGFSKLRRAMLSIINSLCLITYTNCTNSLDADCIFKTLMIYLLGFRL